PITIVSEGKIRLTGFSTGLRAYINDILTFSGMNNGNYCDANTVIYINGAGDSRGILYAPGGQIEVLYNSGTWEGALVGKYVDWWPNTSTVSTLRALSMTIPPFVALVS
ncbi:MAG TPA: hypothetical protein VER79_14860, partial [Candidatus Limnocylindrales bacterium]|nr:hypothetical protein [Candidatus Limnocylindrales bacterium]